MGTQSAFHAYMLGSVCAAVDWPFTVMLLCVELEQLVGRLQVIHALKLHIHHQLNAAYMKG